MAEERPTLYLIDGSGYIFRAFFALPQLNNSRGLPTNAVYGFIRMLLKLLKEERPRHIAVVFDSPRKTFRDDLFESYKANRVETPSDLNVQVPFILRAVEGFRIKSLVLDGFEADDVIATLAAALAPVETLPGLRGAKRVAALLAEHRASAELARKLVSIDTAAPVETEVGQLDWPGIDEIAVSELLRELEFHSLLNELTPAQAALPMGGASEREHEVESGEVAALIARLARAPRLALHLETDEIRPSAVAADLETDGSP